MKNLKSDVDKEKEKYDSIATTEIVSPSRMDSKSNLLEISEWFREPFERYYEEIEKTLQPSMLVLELGGGGTIPRLSVKRKQKLSCLISQRNHLQCAKVCSAKFKQEWEILKKFLSKATL
jgi:hypothetical protein